MKVRESQYFLPLATEPLAIVTASGEADPHIDAASWNRETKSLGQVATPQPIAELMARWVMSLKPATVLDPAAGLGSLLHECHRLNRHSKFVGVERDEPTLLRAKSTAPHGTKLILADYLLSDSWQFQGIIANPPYVKAHRLEYSKGTWRTFEDRFGTPLDRLSNLYALFLLKIWEDLAPNGRAAVILPAELFNANFGEEIKEHLSKVMRPPGIVVFNPALNLFSDALTTSAIIFLEKGRPKSALCKITKADSILEAEAFLDAVANKTGHRHLSTYRDLDSFKPNDKWLNTLLSGNSAIITQHLPRVIGDYFDCRRGIATGANEYFCLNKSGLQQNGLTSSHVNPCVTKATDATGFVFTSEKFSTLVAADRRCYLLNPSHNGLMLDNYLKIGENLGISKRFLPSHRPVWYLPENRAAADIWVSVFSRKTVKFIQNKSNTKNLTCFHGLYAKPGYENIVPLVTLYLNSVWGNHAFSHVNRFYGDGLNKLEPKDVEALPCPELPNWSSSKADQLTAHLIGLEAIPANERDQNVNALAVQYLKLPANHGHALSGQ